MTSFVHQFDLENTDIPQPVLAELLCYCNVLIELCNDSENLTEEQINQSSALIKKLLQFINPQISRFIPSEIPFQRLVVNQKVITSNSRLSYLTNLRYPPLEKQHELDYNRANLPGQSMFYCVSKGLLQAAIETMPEEGQLITISNWIVKPECTLNVITICQDAKIVSTNPSELSNDYEIYLGYLDRLMPNAQRLTKKIYELIVQAFTRPVDLSNRKGYAISALIADYWLNNSSLNIDGIYYPSVPNDLFVMNLAAKPSAVNDKLKMAKAKEDFVEFASAERRAWRLKTNGICTEFNEETLELNWQDC